MNFKSLAYLKIGNPKQRAAYDVLTGSAIMDALRDFDPILVGTIPIEIDIDSSDLDIICEIGDAEEFVAHLEIEFGRYEGFRAVVNSYSCVVANFYVGGFEIEIFGQTMPTTQQNAYLHMLVEYAVLQERGEVFRAQIVELKRSGMKTEPAFARLLGLPGDPYAALLEYGRLNGLIPAV